MARKSGRDFEEAVFSLVKALDPTADVKFDHKVIDRDTGTPRQVDVWVNGKYGGHFPFSLLISCKDYNRKVTVQQMGTFCDELRSTSASFGVIYSHAGFT